MSTPYIYGDNYRFIVPDWEQIKEYLLRYETEGVDILNEILFDAGCEDDFRNFIKTLFENTGTESLKEQILKTYSKIEEQIATLSSRINMPHFEEEGGEMDAQCKLLQKKIEKLFEKINDLV